MLGGAALGQASTVGTVQGRPAGEAYSARDFGRRLDLWCNQCNRTVAQLQGALNRSWKIQVQTGGIGGFIIKRILFFPVVILIAALILASVVLNAWTASVF